MVQPLENCVQKNKKRRESQYQSLTRQDRSVGGDWISMVNRLLRPFSGMAAIENSWWQMEEEEFGRCTVPRSSKLFIGKEDILYAPS